MTTTRNQGQNPPVKLFVYFGAVGLAIWAIAGYNVWNDWKKANDTNRPCQSLQQGMAGLCKGNPL